jgi:ribonuclease J
MTRYIEVIPLGGCGEIGMNMTILKIGTEIFFIDCGALFADSSQVGVKLIIPDYSFLKKNKLYPTAWVITHGHEDHIGALPYLFQKFKAPIYGTNFTIELIKKKFEESKIKDAEFNVWKSGTTQTIQNTRFTPFNVNHSIPEATGLFIESLYGNILHTGDFRIDPTLPNKEMTHVSIKNVVKRKPVHLMLSDSTNSFKAGSDDNEGDLFHNISRIMSKSRGAVILSTFSSNVWRLQTTLAAAKKTSRKVFLLGRSMYNIHSIAEKCNILQKHKDVLIDNINEIKKYDKSQICIVCTGSQGQIFSGLDNLTSHKIKNFQLDSDDTVIFSSRSIPGNEKSIDLLVNKLWRVGCHIVQSEEENKVHVSGHGYQGDLIKCLKAAKPKFFMPVHGTFRHLKQHTTLAIKAGVMPEHNYIVENGFILKFNQNTAHVEGPVDSGRLYVCEGGLLHENHPIYKSRVAISETGCLFVHVNMHKSGFKYATPPTIASFGVAVLKKEVSEYLYKIFARISKLNEKSTISDDHLIIAILKKDLKKFLSSKHKINPQISVTVQRLSR